ncbi:MAG: helix-turn-helix domain-containing protein [Kofleriaceae bacterium]
MAASMIHPGLRDRAVSIGVFDSDGGENHVLPGANAVLGLQLSGHVRAGERRLSRIGVTGIQQTLRTYEYAPVTRSVLVRLAPQGSTCFGVPAWELASRNVGLDELVKPAHTREVMARIEHAAEPADAIAVVEQLLLSMPFAVDPVVERALVLLDRAGDEDKHVARVARTLGLSERQLERRFRDRVGMSPKRFVSLRRFERAVELAISSRSLTRAAVEAGYYDQPHFNREFRRFTGMTPSAWLRMSDPYK